MSDFSKDVFTGLIFTIGILGFISGEFIISSAIFSLAVIGSNIKTNNLHKKVGQLTWV